MKLSQNLKENIKILKKDFSCCDDVVFREFFSGDGEKRSCVLIYSDGMCDKDLLSDRVIKRLIPGEYSYPENIKRPPDEDSPKVSMNVVDYDIGYDTSEVSSAVMAGNGALLVDGERFFINITATKFSSRAISEPKSKGVIRGPRDGFTENFLDSTSLLRRRLKTSDFKMEFLNAGNVAKTRIAVCYLDGEADKDRLSLIRSRIRNINADMIIDSGQLQNIITASNGIIPDIQSSERVDDAVFAINEGKIVLLVENSPFVLIIPGLLLSMLTSSEDYYSSSVKRNAILFLRIISCVITVLLPAVYIGFIKFTPDFLPDKIILMLSMARRNVALPAFIEILFMQLVFEVIMEAAMRLPGQIASTVGIVGSIVVGQAIVDANLVNIMVVIIVSLNAILTFVIPSFELSKTLRIIRLGFMVISAAFGMYGVSVAFAVMMIYLSDMESFGAEFLFPFVERNVRRKNGA
ncbi:MAG: spore germination protein [Eubacteriaceae bacterium]|nr:spore germination protein [Eubacteriaceae bacterium]